MPKKILPLVIIMLFISIFSGCTSQQSYSRYNNWDWDLYYSIYDENDFVFYLETPIFDFSDVVNENGSVTNSTKITVPLIIENKNDFFSIEDIEFEIVEFPLNLQVWSTSIILTDFYNTSLFLYNDYGFHLALIKDDIPPEGKAEIHLAIQFNKTIKNTYIDRSLYVCHLEISHEESYGVDNVTYSRTRHKTIGFNIIT